MDNYTPNPFMTQPAYLPPLITGKFFSASSCGGLLIFASVMNKLSNEFYLTVFLLITIA